MLEAGETDIVVLERGDDVGGTWRDNTYPGCACDVPSHLYSFSFAPNPDWTRTYSPQPEIQDYLRRCADDLGVRSYVETGTEVTSAAWDDGEAVWRIETSRGPLTAEVFVAATGPLSEPAVPDVPGLDTFAGAVFHSAQWDHDHDLAGERVAVIGTGASAIQFVPAIASIVDRLHVFQRTAPWVMPRPDRPIPRLARTAFRRLPWLQKLMRTLIYWRQELLVPGLVYRPQLLKVVEAVGRKHLRDQVPDPELRAKLTPHYRVGCKRILLSNDWYPALTRRNVEVVTDGIAEVREHSVVTTDGTAREVDTIILGTGFHTTDIAIADRIKGRDGETLADVWQGSPSAYIGTAVPGFPNMFFMVGPNTGPGHTSVVFYIESQIRYILDALATMSRDGVGVVDVRRDVFERFNDRLQQRMQRTVWMTGGCQSWYVDNNGRNSTLWPGPSFEVRWRMRRFDLEHYDVRVAERRRATVSSNTRRV